MIVCTSPLAKPQNRTWSLVTSRKGRLGLNQNHVPVRVLGQHLQRSTHVRHLWIYGTPRSTDKTEDSCPETGIPGQMRVCDCSTPTNQLYANKPVCLDPRKTDLSLRNATSSGGEATNCWPITSGFSNSHGTSQTPDRQSADGHSTSSPHARNPIAILLLPLPTGTRRAPSERKGGDVGDRTLQTRSVEVSGVFVRCIPVWCVRRM
jgi:hypothetical protein